MGPAGFPANGQSDHRIGQSEHSFELGGAPLTEGSALLVRDNHLYVLDAARSDLLGFDLAGAATIAEEAEQLLAELNVNPGAAATAVSPRETTAAPSENPPS